MPRPKDSVTRRVGPKQTVRFDLPCGTSIYVYNPHSRLHIKPTLSRGVSVGSGLEASLLPHAMSENDARDLRRLREMPMPSAEGIGPLPPARGSDAF